MSDAKRENRRLRLAAGAVSALGLLGALAACGGSTNASDPVASTSGSTGNSPASSPDLTASGSPVPAPSDSDQPSATVPVYWVGETPQGPRLFRETTEVPSDAPLDGAVQTLMSGKPADPDYRSSYAAGAFGDVSYDESKGFTVALTDRSLTKPGSLSRPEAMIAVEQLVYTLEAVQQTKDAPVRVVADGKPVRLYGVNTAEGLRPVDELDVLALVNVTSPAQGDTVSGRITARGLASSPEATVPWTVKDSDGKVVKKGFATATGWLDKLYPWKTSIDLSGLAPGDYTFTASTDDPSAGAEGHGPTRDTKSITVK